MVQTYSDDGSYYSVDMMQAYVNIFKPPVVSVKVSDYTDTLDYDGWGESNSEGSKYSAKDVLNNPKKYRDEMRRINDADLTYPIIISDCGDKKYIVDGVHRLTKATLTHQIFIKAVIISPIMMKKFKVSKKLTNSTNYTCESIELFYKRFK